MAALGVPLLFSFSCWTKSIVWIVFSQRLTSHRAHSHSCCLDGDTSHMLILRFALWLAVVDYCETLQTSFRSCVSCMGVKDRSAEQHSDQWSSWLLADLVCDPLMQSRLGIPVPVVQTLWATGSTGQHSAATASSFSLPPFKRRRQVSLVAVSRIPRTGDRQRF